MYSTWKLLTYHRVNNTIQNFTPPLGCLTGHSKCPENHGESSAQIRETNTFTEAKLSWDGIPSFQVSIFTECKCWHCLAWNDMVSSDTKLYYIRTMHKEIYQTKYGLHDIMWHNMSWNYIDMKWHQQRKIENLRLSWVECSHKVTGKMC